MPLTTRLFLLFSRTIDAFREAAEGDRSHRSAYFKNGEIHVNILGTPEGKPLTTGHWDFKPSWSKTNDKLVFFRRVKNHPQVGMWKTAICIINADGTGFTRLRMPSTPTSTRLGLVTARTRLSGIEKTKWRRLPRHGGKDWREARRGDRSYQPEIPHVGTCMTDGRILVNHSHPEQGRVIT